MIKVPVNCSVAFWCKAGAGIYDDMGRLIEEGTAGLPTEILGPGDVVADHLLLHSSTGNPLLYSSNPVGEVLEAKPDKGIWLSEIFEQYPEGIDLRWAACRFILDTCSK